ncbi:MAG: hypothetical protein ACFCBW_08505 [Candidatus Competibacterales bacterium]
MTRRFGIVPRALTSALIALALGAPALAEMQVLKGPDIEAAIAGNTVQGAMASGSRYTEFYSSDGEIRGDGYTGQWQVKDDQMCFQYAGEESPSCWNVGRMGDEVRWLKDGEVDGSGTLIPGNPLEF